MFSAIDGDIPDVQYKRVPMRLILSVSLFTTLISQSAFATNDRDFLSVQFKQPIEKAYTSKNRDEVIETVKTVMKSHITKKWHVMSCLAEKIDRELPPLEEITNRLLVKTYTETTPNAVFLKTDINSLDDKFSDFFRHCNLQQIKIFLSGIHKDIFTFDVLAYSLINAPDSLWVGAEFTPVQPEETTIKYWDLLLVCYRDLWKNRFPASQSVINTNMEADQKYKVHSYHDFPGYSPERRQSSGFLANVLYPFTLLKNCGKKYGRIRDSDPSLFLMEPAARLCQFATNPQFPAIFDRTLEIRIQYNPWYSHLRFLLPWYLLIKDREVHARYIAAKGAIVKFQPSKTGSTRLPAPKSLPQDVQRIAELEKTIAKMQAGKTSQKKQIKSLSDEKEKLQKDHDALVLQHQNSDAGKSKQENKNLRDSITFLKENIDELNTTIKRQCSDLEGKDILINSYKQQLQQRQNKLEIHQAESILKATIDELRTKIQLMEDIAKSKAILIEKQAQECKKMQATLRANNAELEHLRTNQKALQNEVKSETRAQDEIAQKLERERLARDRTEKELKLRREQLAKQNERNRELQKQLEAAKDFLTQKEMMQNSEQAIFKAGVHAIEDVGDKDDTSGKQLINAMAEQIQLDQSKYIIQLHSHVNMAAFHIQELHQQCSILQQELILAHQRLQVYDSTENELQLEAAGEIFLVTPEKMVEYARLYLIEQVIRKRDEETSNSNNE